MDWPEDSQLSEVSLRGFTKIQIWGAHHHQSYGTVVDSTGKEMQAWRPQKTVTFVDDSCCEPWFHLSREGGQRGPPAGRDMFFESLSGWIEQSHQNIRDGRIYD